MDESDSRFRMKELRDRMEIAVIEAWQKEIEKIHKEIEWSNDYEISVNYQIDSRPI